MTLKDILTADCTACAVPASSKKRILDTICELAATKIPTYTPYELFESLIAREKLGSTGIGNGIAVPHGRLTATQQAIAVVVTSKEPVAFNAIDNRPVDIFVALFVPEDACQEHLSTLQSIAKFLGNTQTAKQVRKCQSNQELFELLKHAK